MIMTIRDWDNLSSWKRKTSKWKLRIEWDSNLWPLWYRCSDGRGHGLLLVLTHPCLTLLFCCCCFFFWAFFTRVSLLRFFWRAYQINRKQNTNWFSFYDFYTLYSNVVSELKFKLLAHTVGEGTMFTMELLECYRRPFTVQVSWTGLLSMFQNKNK